jgi:hypothetical protein
MLQLQLFLGVFFGTLSVAKAEGDAADTIGTILFVLLILTCLCAGLGYYKRTRS